MALQSHGPLTGDGKIVNIISRKIEIALQSHGPLTGDGKTKCDGGGPGTTHIAKPWPPDRGRKGAVTAANTIYFADCKAMAPDRGRKGCLRSLEPASHIKLQSHGPLTGDGK